MSTLTFLCQKPVVEELCTLLSREQLQAIFSVARQLFIALNKERPLYVALEATRCDALQSCRFGWLDILQYHYYNGVYTNSYSWAEEAAASGHLCILIWLKEETQMHFSCLTTNAAAKYGHLNVIQWMHNSNIGIWSESAMNVAAIYGRFNVVLWLHENRSEGCSASIVNCVRSNNNYEMALWLERNRPECRPNST
jgi:hypothetical protein